MQHKAGWKLSVRIAGILPALGQLHLFLKRSNRHAAVFQPLEEG
jgi:hypothetical protein